MAIASNPKRNIDTRAENFIAGAGKPVAEELDEGNRKPIMIRAQPAMIARIDAAAKRLGLTRTAFIISAAAEKLERMEGANEKSWRDHQ
jgi:hypothetical protein